MEESQDKGTENIGIASRTILGTYIPSMVLHKKKLTFRQGYLIILHASMVFISRKFFGLTHHRQ
jgi:hypothetical protein